MMTPATCQCQFLRNPHICFLSLLLQLKDASGVVFPLRALSAFQIQFRPASSVYCRHFIWTSFRVDRQARIHTHRTETVCVKTLAYAHRHLVEVLLPSFCDWNKTACVHVCCFGAEGAEQHGAQRDGEGWAQHQSFCGELCLEAR